MTNNISSDFVAEFRAEIAAVKARLTGLENLANRLGYTVDVPDVDSVPESALDTDAPSTAGFDDSDRDVHGRPSGVDYGAVAYGLTDLKSKLRGVVTISDHELDNYYRAVVEWNVACFVGDVSFDAAAFRRDAGV
jgi:hypothetical protein